MRGTEPRNRHKDRPVCPVEDFLRRLRQHVGKLSGQLVLAVHLHLQDSLSQCPFIPVGRDSPTRDRRQDDDRSTPGHMSERRRHSADRWGDLTPRRTENMPCQREPGEEPTERSLRLRRSRAAFNRAMRSSLVLTDHCTMDSSATGEMLCGANALGSLLR